MSTATDLELIAMVVALVAMVRDQFPALNGKLYVFGLAAGIALGLCFLVGGDTVRSTLQHALVIAMTAAGGMHALSYHATKSVSPVLTSLEALQSGDVVMVKPSVRPPPKPTNLGLGLAYSLGLGALLAALSFGTSSCAGVQKRDIKTIVDITKSLVEEVCSPEDPTLDACIDKLLSSPKVQAARAAAHKPPYLPAAK